MSEPVTEWGRPVAIVRLDSGRRWWRIYKPRDNPFPEHDAWYSDWRLAAEIAMDLYGDVVVEAPPR